MRKTLFCFLLFMAMNVMGQEIGNVKFGTDQTVAVEGLKAFFGEPKFLDADCVVYTDKHYGGFKWNEVIFRFKNGRFNEARFYMNQKNKTSAKRALENIASVLKKKHELTLDIEEDGSPFYSGGRSPMPFGHLFTLFVSPRSGGWTNQVRFGPFRF